MRLWSPLEEQRVIITADQLEELKELIDRHAQESDCQRDGNCCADLILEFLKELLEDA
jgi:hypothetical protein